MHWGIDIAAPMYTPMYSAGDGVVVEAGPATGFGQAVYIQHDNGDVTVYGHMEVIEVTAGQRVVAGQEIALVADSTVSASTR
jgi:murein DD-endopeptidase MepM/ murein hydrolase activator NlpD